MEHPVLIGKGTRYIGVALVTILVLIALFNLFSSGTRPPFPRQGLAFSEFIADLEGGQLADVVMAGREITGHFMNGTAFSTYAAEMPDLTARLLEKRVRITAAPAPDNVPTGLSILISWMPLFLWLLAIWYFVTRPLRAVTAVLGRIDRTIAQAGAPIDGQGPPSPGAH